MNSKSRFSSLCASAFTLVELLVVITVISILLAFAAPALFNGLGASRLTGAGDTVMSALSEAQQTAFAQNIAVEVQFYAYPDVMEAQAAFRALRMFRVTNPPGTAADKVTGLGEIIKFPSGIIIATDATLSPLLAGSDLPDTLESSGITGATYAAIRFLPDGTCRKVTAAGAGLAALTLLGLPESFLTLVEDDGKTYTSTQLPTNFYTIQTDPITGKSRSYRPGF
jgi:uncharacterized protein (TIGR02596 family)